jgi:stage II sporulation protein D
MKLRSDKIGIAGLILFPATSRPLARIIASFLLTSLIFSASFSQVRVRIFASSDPTYAVFTVISGQYRMETNRIQSTILSKGDLVIISDLNGRLAVKSGSSPSLICDSVQFIRYSGDVSFTVRINGNNSPRQLYYGDLKCKPDLETIILINTCDIDSYVAGVVKAEGGTGRNIEYCKIQAILARTYLYKYFDKHGTDGYNLCDNTHCQAFNGVTKDTLISRATLETSGMVILAPDSSLAIAAFHSNCGGETSPAEYVWLSGQPYLKSVTDPWCRSSRNASWTKTISFKDWTAYLARSGFSELLSDRSLFSFMPAHRQNEYHVGTIKIPMRQIRNDLNLRSAFFTVNVTGDSVVLNGRGYGHGVGLCQEGAMSMAERGYTYTQILRFYYSGVIIADISKAVRKDETVKRDTI